MEAASEKLLYASAVAFATAAHEGQTRLSGEPYITHPVAVATAVFVAGGDPAMVATAVLHDVVEDCDVTLDEIRTRFGDDVAELVDALSRRKTEGETHREYLHRVIAAGPRAIAIKRADAAHNLSTCPPDHTLRTRFEWALATLPS